MVITTISMAAEEERHRGYGRHNRTLVITVHPPPKSPSTRVRPWGLSPWSCSGRFPHSSPLQDSGLGNPAGRGAWRPTVRGVAESRTHDGADPGPGQSPHRAAVTERRVEDADCILLGLITVAQHPFCPHRASFCPPRPHPSALSLLCLASLAPCTCSFQNILSMWPLNLTLFPCEIGVMLTNRVVIGLSGAFIYPAQFSALDD